MASEQFSSGLGAQLLTPTTISLGLVPNPQSPTPYVPPTKKDWDILFQLMFDEYFCPPQSVAFSVLTVVASLVPAVVALVHADSTSALVSFFEPNNYKEALKESYWIEAIQEELNEFERLEVWELIPRLDRVMIITLK
nr:Gag-Pol polyprotein [Tanacetum cinerariifolium]